MNLTSLLLDNAARCPDRIALADQAHGRERTVTYGQLARRMAAGAATLRRLGLPPGRTLLVFQPVSIELYELMLAAFHGGLRVMLADPSAGREFLAHCCDRVPPDAFFGPWPAQVLRWTTPALRRIPLAIRTGGWLPGTVTWQPGDEVAHPVEVGPDEPALITFTSGGTGTPKAAVRSHGFLLAQHRALARALTFEDGEADLITLPVFVLANLASGLTSVLAATNLARPGTPDAAAVRAQCARFGVTRCTASPAFFEGLLAGGKMPAFAKVFTGGAPVYPDLRRRLRAALPDAAIHAVYGSTEAEPIAHCGESAAATTVTAMGGGLCAGPPVPDLELRIIADHWGAPLGPLDEAAFAALTVPSGQAGEIVVAGDHVLGGYLNGVGDNETKVAVADRVWHRTGDAGWLDAAGRLWLLGRGAAKLPAFPAHPDLPADALAYPFAVECALRETFPDIRAAAIEWHGERVLAVAPPPAPPKLAALTEAARAFGIGRVTVLATLPLDRRHQAKIDYPALRQAMAEATGDR